MKRETLPELKAQAREVWRLSLPAILTQITTIAMQYIDSAMVGALGANASASIGLVSTSTWLIGGIIGGVSAGFSVQASHRIGGGDDRGARTVVRHGLVTGMLIAAILVVWALLDRVRYNRYRRRYILGAPVNVVRPVYYPIFWGRHLRPRPPRSHRPPQGGYRPPTGGPRPPAGGGYRPPQSSYRPPRGNSRPGGGFGGGSRGGGFGNGGFGGSRGEQQSGDYNSRKI